MKKFFAIILAAVTLTLCLTGCVYEDLNVKLNKDGTGNIATTVGLKKDFVDQMLGGQNPFEGKETQEIEVDGDKYIAYTETKDYASFEEIEKALADLTYDTGDFGDTTEPVNDETEDVIAEPADSEDSAGDFFLTDPVEETPAVNSDDHIFKSVEITKDGSKYVFDAVLNKVEGQVQGYDMSDVFKVSISVEMPAKISALFEKQWESIVGNCDEFLYLGGNEQSTHEYVSKLLGKETIDMNTYGQSRGRNGNYSTNWQITGRELMTPDEVRMLDNKYALLFIRGERPVMDYKYDILKHPNVAMTTDGKAEPYRHGKENFSCASIQFDEDLLSASHNDNDVDASDFVILTEEEVNEILSEKTQTSEKNKEVILNEAFAQNGKSKKHRASDAGEG